MIDFHTHILPNMDDGSRSVEQSVTMLTRESKQGITDVFLTPHYYADENSPAEFLARREQAWKELKPHLLPEHPAVYLGAEVQYFEGICRVADIHLLKIEGTDYLLLEMPFARWTERIIDDVLELNEQPGIQVVLAHIERYLKLQPASVWRGLRERGVLMQVNVSFFADWKSNLRAARMLAKEEIHFLGSDCHSMNIRRPNWDLLPDRIREKWFSSESRQMVLRQR